MSRRRVRIDAASHHPVSRVARRLGLAVVAAALPVVVGLTAGLLVDAGSLTAGIGVLVSALTGSLGAQSGSVWLFHAATLVLAGGGWLLGAGLLIDGLD